LVTGVAEGDILILKVNGTAGGTAFSEYAIPVRVVGSSSLTSAETWKHDISLFTLLPSSYAGHKLVDIETAVTTSIPANISALNDFDPAADTVANVTTVASVTNAVTTDTASRDASKADVSTLATAASIAALNDFDPTADTVANVTTVGSVTNPVATDAASRTASQADVSSLATSAEIAALNNFDPATDQVVVATNNDKTGYSISGTKTTLDALNDIAATEIVSGGAINTSAGAVSNVTTVATTTTNTDMVDISGLATSASIAALNDLSAAEVWSYATRTITSGGITASEVTDAVWDASVSSHNDAGSFGRGFRQVKEGLVSTDGQVDDASATATSFVSNLTETVDDYWNEKVINFISGNLVGQSRVIYDYDGTTKTISVEEAFTSAPDNSSEFIILSVHVHPLDEIANAVWNEPRAGNTTAGTFGYYLDARVSESGGAGASAADIWGALLSDYAVSGTFGARFQEADRYTNTTANIIYVNQGDAYDDTANNAIVWLVSKDYSAADSLTLIIEHRVTGSVLLTHAVTYIDATTLKAYLSSSDTAFSTLTTDADFGVHPYRVEADYSGEVQTVVRGAVTIRKT